MVRMCGGARGRERVCRGFVCSHKGQMKLILMKRIGEGYDTYYSAMDRRKRKNGEGDIFQWRRDLKMKKKKKKKKS